MQKLELSELLSKKGWEFKSYYLRGLWTLRRSNQSVLKEIDLEYSLEGLMLKLNNFDT